ncbi:MAG: hypothetical protein KA149_09180, partial [Chitinophagales bacterium]|nr:hypothetical protein [Chitinophagales bacterium]
PLKEVTPQTFHKYDTEISSGLTNYAFFQFVLVLVATTTFLLFHSKPPFSQNWALTLLAAALIIFSLTNIGGIFERKSWVTALEYLRIVAISALFIMLLKGTAFFTTAIITIAAVALLSLLWFTKYREEFSRRGAENAENLETAA